MLGMDIGGLLCTLGSFKGRCAGEREAVGLPQVRDAGKVDRGTRDGIEQGFIVE